MAEGFFPEDTFLSDVHIGTFEVPSVKVGCVGGYIYVCDVRGVEAYPL